MKKVYINEKSASMRYGFVLASNNGIIEEGDKTYASVEDIINTLQNEANVIAGDLMSKEMNPSPENEIDRRYAIGKWDKLNELITLFKCE